MIVESDIAAVLTQVNMFASKRLNLFVVIVAKLLRANGGCLGVK